jgi:acetyltransferase
MEKLSPLNPPWLPLGNPLDMWPSVMKHGARPVYKTYLQALLGDENVDAVFCVILTPKIPGQEFFDVSEEIIEAAIRFPTKPIVVWGYGPDLEEMQEKWTPRAAWSSSLLPKGRFSYSMLFQNVTRF